MKSYDQSMSTKWININTPDRTRRKNTRQRSPTPQIATATCRDREAGCAADDWSQTHPRAARLTKRATQSVPNMFIIKPFIERGPTDTYHELRYRKQVIVGVKQIELDEDNSGFGVDPVWLLNPQKMQKEKRTQKFLGLTWSSSIKAAALSAAFGTDTWGKSTR